MSKYFAFFQFHINLEKTLSGLEQYFPTVDFQTTAIKPFQLGDEGVAFKRQKQQFDKPPRISDY